MAKLLGDEETWVMTYQCSSRDCGRMGSGGYFNPKGRLVISDQRVRFVPAHWRPGPDVGLPFDQPWENVGQVALYDVPRGRHSFAMHAALILVDLIRPPRHRVLSTTANVPYPFWAKATHFGDLVSVLPKAGLARLGKEDIWVRQD